GIEIIASSGEATSAFHVVAPSVPVTSKNAVANSSACQWITHMRALIICGKDVASMLKKSDAAAVHLDGFWSSFDYILKVSHLNEIIRHCSLLNNVFAALRSFASLREIGLASQVSRKDAKVHSAAVRPQPK